MSDFMSIYAVSVLISVQTSGSKKKAENKDNQNVKVKRGICRHDVDASNKEWVRWCLGEKSALAVKAHKIY